ncbi:MAG TPA: DNA recombination protein RmuC [Acidimicrobiia bacterium]|nr:DNA recombination protein RmuC [Acidimicrobiia bacterium]
MVIVAVILALLAGAGLAAAGVTAAARRREADLLAEHDELAAELAAVREQLARAGAELERERAVSAERLAAREEAEARLAERFTALSTEVLERNNRSFLTLAQQQLAGAQQRAAHELEGKKSLIDQQLESMVGELGKVRDLVGELERDRHAKFGALAAQLQRSNEGMAALQEVTQGLRQALSSTKARGQWGERMAEDVLRLAGFIENVNYRKQRAIDGGGIPDFTFLLPQDQSLFMDVKFPLDNYLRFLEAESELDRKRYRDEFLRDVRHRVKELAARDYASRTGAALDCVLLFIPNEALYAFIQEHDASILEEALRHKIVCCSPLTLFAVLAVIRQAADNFRLERTSNEILGLLGAFDKQWHAFVDKMDKLDRSLTTARKDYEELVGTRRRQLERPLEQIKALRREHSLSAADDHDDGDGGMGRLALEA